MKRNYTKAFFAAAFAAVMLASGMLASADSGWHVLKNGQPQQAPKAKTEMTPVEKYHASIGFKNPGARVQPMLGGEMPTPKISQKARNILRSPQEPRGTIYAILPRYDGLMYNTQARLAQLDLKTGALNTVLQSAVFCPLGGDDYLLQTHCYRKGKIWSPQYLIEDNASNYGALWRVMDMETGDIEATYTFSSLVDPDSYLANLYSMTYDSKNDVFWGVALSNNGDGHLVKIDPKVLESGAEPNTAITGFGSLRERPNNCGYVGALAYNPLTDKIYVFNNANKVYEINQEDGIAIEVGEFDGAVLLEEGISGQVCYSPSDESFVAILRDNTEQVNRVLYLNPEDFSVEEGVTIAPALKPFISTIFCTDEFADANAPEMVGEPVINFVDASLSGSISFFAPSFTYVGIDLGNTPFKTVAKVDGKTIYEGNPKPGEKITLNQTFEEGLHQLEITSYIGEYASPTRKVDFYTGYDAPKAPANVSLRLNTLSWKNPGNVGANNGYVVPANFTYDVYLNGVKQNSEPITDTSFELTQPAEQTICKFEVFASANGHTSAAGTLNEVYGKALQLPLAQEPSREEAQLYRVINHNNDNRIFFWTDDRASGNVNGYGWAMSVGYTDNADDWLVFPLINFPSKDYLYTLEFDLAGMMLGVRTVESYEIYLGKEPNVQSMLNGTNIYSDNYFEYNEEYLVERHQTINFAVKEAGDYYLAIRVNSTKDENGQGLLFNDFKLRVAEGKSTAVPGDPTKVEILPDPTGMTEFTANVTLPVNDITGAPLPADSDITMTVSYGGRTESATGKPGDVVTLKMGVDNDGYANLLFTPSNENGSGYPRTHRQYIGIDQPLCPTNIKATPTEDNVSVKLTWDAPGTTGFHGGYVDVDDLKYNIYIRSGIALAKVGETRDLSYTFSPFTGDNHTLEAYYVGSSAENEGGESVNSIFVQECLGDPYELPMYEEWGTQKFKYMPYNFVATDQYKGSDYQSVGTMSGLGIGDPVFVEGGIIGTSTAGQRLGELILPKATTKGVQKIIFTYRYWDYADAPATLQVKGRRFGHEDLEVLHTVTTQRPATPQWIDVEFSLPAEYCDCSWIQLRLSTSFTGAEKEYVVYDNYKLMPDSDYDLKITSLSGPTQVSIGDIAKYRVSVANAGRERMDGNLTIQLQDLEGNVLATDNVAVNTLNSAQVFEHETSIEINGEFRDLNQFKVVVKLEAENDENTSNNTRILTADLMGSQLPVVSDLQGALNDKNEVELSWSTPNTEYGDFENFESLTPYKITDKIGNFRNVSLDDMLPVDLGQGDQILEWPGSHEAQAWTVVNCEELGLMNDPRIYPHSGKQYIMARPGYYEETEQPKQTSKWLISPEIKGNTTVSFWLSTMTNQYTEYLEIWTSSTNDNLAQNDGVNNRFGSFNTRIRSISKSGAEDWEFISEKLPRTAKYFAIRFCSYDGMAVVIDDLAYTPAKMSNRDIDHYSVWRADNGNEPFLVADNITGNSYTDATWADSKAYYHVLTHSDVEGEVKPGPKSNLIFINGSSVGTINADQTILGGPGQIRVNNLAGEAITIATADGKIVKNGTVDAPQAYYSVEKGIYIVTAGNITAKVIVR